MYNTVINGTLLFSFLCAIIFCPVMFKYGGDYYKYFYLVLLVIFSNVIYKLFSYILAVFQKTTELVKNNFYKDAIAAALGISMVVVGFSFYGILYATISTNIAAGFFIYYRLTKRELPYKLFIDKIILVTFLKMSLPLLPVFFFSWIIQSSDSYFLAYYKGKGIVGKYSVIYGLTNIVLALTYALNFFWFPFSARLWVENREKYRKAFISIFAAISTLLFIVVLFFELNSWSIIKLFVRRAEYQDAYVIMGIIAFAFAMQVLITLLTAPLYSNRNVNFIFFSYSVGGLTNIALNFMLIPSMSIMGAALSTAASYLIIVILMSYLNYRVAEFEFFDSRLLYITGAFIISWAGVAYLKEKLGIYQTILANIVLLPALVTPVYFKVLKKEEKEYLLNIYKEFKLKKVTTWARR